MDPRIHWIWLSQALGQGSAKVRAVHAAFGSSRAFYEAGAKEWRLSGLFTAAEIARLSATPLSLGDEILRDCKRFGYHVITPDDPAYPNRLLNIPDYPAALYVWGEPGEVDDEILIAVVGTRDTSPYGREIATRITVALAKAGAVVVSGAAYGIDTVAHRGALMGGGRTIAVLGCGINTKYLSENEELRGMIARQGAVISEYPPGTPPSRVSFPIRNRLIAGLSLGTLVVEAGVKSGSLITAHRALDQGRDVFAVPGSVTSAGSAGCNRLLTEGAKPVGCAMDILEEYMHIYPHRLNLTDPAIREPAWAQSAVTPVHPAADQATASPRRTAPAKPVKPKAVPAVPVAPAAAPAVRHIKQTPPGGLSPAAAYIYKALDFSPRHIDDLAAAASLATHEALSAVTELELMGLIASHPGRRFSVAESADA